MDRRWDKSKPPRGRIVLNRDCAQAQGIVLWLPVGGEVSGWPQLWDHAGRFNVGGNFFNTQGGWVQTLGSAGEPVGDYNGSTAVVQSAAVPHYTAPLTVGAWFRKPVAVESTQYGLFTTGDYTLSSGPRRFQLDTYNGSVRWVSAGSSTGVAYGASGMADGRWHHAIGIEQSATSRYAGLDGALGTQETTSSTPGGTENRTVIGSIFNGGSNSGFFLGQIGEVCVWNVDKYAQTRLIADPGRRFELWYPLRSRKWFVQAAVAPMITSLSARLITTTSAQPRISYS